MGILATLGYKASAVLSTEEQIVEDIVQFFWEYDWKPIMIEGVTLRGVEYKAMTQEDAVEEIMTAEFTDQMYTFDITNRTAFYAKVVDGVLGYSDYDDKTARKMHEYLFLRLHRNK